MSAAYSDAAVLDMLWRFHALNMPASQIAPLHDTTRSAVLGMVARCQRAGEAFPPDMFADATLLSMLDDLHGRGIEALHIGKRMGINRAAVLWLAHVIRLDLARTAGEPRATRIGNRNGDLPLAWWTAGAWKQEGAACAS